VADPVHGGGPTPRKDEIDRPRHPVLIPSSAFFFHGPAENKAAKIKKNPENKEKRKRKKKVKEERGKLKEDGTSACGHLQRALRENERADRDAPR
jgi:hypothetical protein